MVYLIMTLQDFDYNLTNTVAALDIDLAQKKMKKMRIFPTETKYVTFKNTTNISFLQEVSMKLDTNRFFSN